MDAALRAAQAPAALHALRIRLCLRTYPIVRNDAASVDDVRLWVRASLTVGASARFDSICQAAAVRSKTMESRSLFMGAADATVAHAMAPVAAGVGATTAALADHDVEMGEAAAAAEGAHSSRSPQDAASMTEVADGLSTTSASAAVDIDAKSDVTEAEVREDAVHAERCSDVTEPELRNRDESTSAPVGRPVDRGGSRKRARDEGAEDVQESESASTQHGVLADRVGGLKRPHGDNEDAADGDQPPSRPVRQKIPRELAALSDSPSTSKSRAGSMAASDKAPAAADATASKARAAAAAKPARASKGRGRGRGGRKGKSSAKSERAAEKATDGAATVNGGPAPRSSAATTRPRRVSRGKAVVDADSDDEFDRRLRVVDGVEEPLESDDDDIRCQICSGQEDNPKMLLCDGCDRGFHFYCLPRPMLRLPPGENWWCEACSNSCAATAGLPYRVGGALRAREAADEGEEGDESVLAADWRQGIVDSIGCGSASEIQVLVHFSEGRVGVDEWLPASEEAGILQHIDLSATIGPDGDMDEEESDGDETCAVCGYAHESTSLGALLLCDSPGCDGAYHQRCLAVPLESVPDGDWFCERCVERQLAGGSTAEAIAVMARTAKRWRLRARQTRSSAQLAVLLGALEEALLLDTQSAAVRRLQKLHGVGRGGGANAGAAENSGLRFLERRVGEGGFVEYLVEPAPQEVIIAVRIPHDAQPGSVMQLQLQGNGQATVMIPEGASPGATLSVKVPVPRAAATHSEEPLSLKSWKTLDDLSSLDATLAMLTFEAAHEANLRKLAAEQQEIASIVETLVTTLERRAAAAEAARIRQAEAQRVAAANALANRRAREAAAEARTRDASLQMRQGSSSAKTGGRRSSGSISHAQPRVAQARSSQPMPRPQTMRHHTRALPTLDELQESAAAMRQQLSMRSANFESFSGSPDMHAGDGYGQTLLPDAVAAASEYGRPVDVQHASADAFTFGRPRFDVAGSAPSAILSETQQATCLQNLSGAAAVSGGAAVAEQQRRLLMEQRRQQQMRMLEQQRSGSMGNSVPFSCVQSYEEAAMLQQRHREAQQRQAAAAETRQLEVHRQAALEAHRQAALEAQRQAAQQRQAAEAHRQYDAQRQRAALYGGSGLGGYGGGFHSDLGSYGGGGRALSDGASHGGMALDIHSAGLPMNASQGRAVHYQGHDGVFGEVMTRYCSGGEQDAIGNPLGNERVGSGGDAWQQRQLNIVQQRQQHQVMQQQQRLEAEHRSAEARRRAEAQRKAKAQPQRMRAGPPAHVAAAIPSIVAAPGSTLSQMARELMFSIRPDLRDVMDSMPHDKQESVLNTFLQQAPAGRELLASHQANMGGYGNVPAACTPGQPTPQHAAAETPFSDAGVSAVVGSAAGAKKKKKSSKKKANDNAPSAAPKQGKGKKSADDLERERQIFLAQAMAVKEAAAQRQAAARQAAEAAARERFAKENLQTKKKSAEEKGKQKTATQRADAHAARADAQAARAAERAAAREAERERKDCLGIIDKVIRQIERQQEVYQPDGTIATVNRVHRVRAVPCRDWRRGGERCPRPPKNGSQSGILPKPCVADKDEVLDVDVRKLVKAARAVPPLIIRAKWGEGAIEWVKPDADEGSKDPKWLRIKLRCVSTTV